MPERHSVRRPFKGVHRLCQLGAAGWELFMRQFCSILLPSLPRVSWWLVRVAFVPHQAQSTIYCTCLDELGGEGQEPLERRCRQLRLVFPIYLAADTTKPHSESQDQAECFQRIRTQAE